MLVEGKISTLPRVVNKFFQAFILLLEVSYQIFDDDEDMYVTWKIYRAV